MLEFELPNNGRRAVGVGVDVQWVVVRFSVWVIFSGCEVERDILVIYYFQVALHCDFQTDVPKDLRKFLPDIVTGSCVYVFKDG